MVSTSGGHGQVREGAYYNPYTGRYGSAGVYHNPRTGASGAYRAGYNPYTGRAGVVGVRRR